ncbi:MarR family protein [Candidatus Norongarragalina meridionalis]|nr:MarR family protein [Candidatus Norongarragalina meridionalis]
MRNRIVGILIIGIAAVIGLIVYLFNRALTDIVSTACTHGTSCPMWGTLTLQTNIGIGIMLFIVLIGLYLIFFGEEERIITKFRTIKPSARQFEPKRVSKENYAKAMATLSGEEKNILERIIEAEGTIFQAQLAESTGFPKVKVTRILDRLEAKGLVERRRRGMSNVVVLKPLG